MGMFSQMKDSLSPLSFTFILHHGTGFHSMG
jgi:hypothetical protein